MRTMLKWISRLKWLGLLSVMRQFSNWFVWELFLLFWLLAILEIFITFPVFVQSLRQIIGIVVANVKNKPLPDKDNFIPKVKYSLPFSGMWVAVNGDITKEFSHSWELNSQRYAYDFIILNSEGKSHSGDNALAANYRCYGKEILAPADGIVVEAKTICGNSKIIGDGTPDPLIKDIRGNYANFSTPKMNTPSLRIYCPRV